MPPRMYVSFGKLNVRSSSSPQMTGQTLYIMDRETNTKFLVDSGAEVSLFPASYADRTSGRQGPPLIAANGSPIKSHGVRSFNLRLGNRRFTWQFVLADVQTGILGADFLRGNALLLSLIHI